MQPQSKAEKPETKIRPATALPWKAFANPMRDDMMFLCVDAEPQPHPGVRYLDGTRPMQLPKSIFSGGGAVSDARYAAHACNAYPKLVEVLLAELEIDSRPRTRDEVRSVRERTWALLRDLGEIE